HFLDNMIEGCQVIDFEWNYVYINDAAIKQGRLHPSAYLGKNVFDLFPLTKGSPLYDVLKTCMEKREIQKTEQEFTHADGNKAWFDLHIYPSIEGIFILSLDITESKQAEHELLISEHKFKTLTEHSIDIISIVDKDLKFIYRSPSGQKHTGWTIEELNSTSMKNFIHAEDLHLIDEWRKMAMDYPARPIPVSARMLHRKGHYISLEGTITNLLDDEAIGGIVLSVRDVTWRKRSEQSLIKNQKELKQVQEIAKLAYLHFDLAGESSFWSEEMYNIWQQQEGLFNLTLDNFLKTIYEEDKVRVEEFLLKLFAGFANHEIEYRIQMADGSIKHIFQRMELEKNEAGIIVALNGIVLDTTERRKVENALKESDEKFRKLFNSSPLPQWLFDSITLEFIDVNAAAIANYGYSQEEFLSMTIEDIRPSNDVAQLLKTRQRIAHSRDDFSSRSFIHKKKNGELINVDIKSANVIINGRNARVVIARDITSDLAFEKQLIESNDRYNLVLEATNESIIDWDIVNDTTVWGKGFSQNFGYDLNVYDNHLWSRNIHKDDREEVLNDLAIALADPLTRNFEAAFRYIKANGEIAYVQHRGILIRNDEGTAIRAIGAMIDVTELQEKISEIETRNKKLKNIAWTQSHLVRAPLAKLIGLIKLVENKDVATSDYAELSKILSYIVSSAYQLDEIIKDIVKKTETMHQ
ncbi:MAG: PAS domain-containing protein, partial [Bacteroidota bacterium]